MHLVSKKTQGAGIVKLYDKARMPHQRLMEHLPEGLRKERLKAFHESLDPIALTLRLQQCRTEILHLLQRRSGIGSE